MSFLTASVWLDDRRVGELRQDDLGYIEFHPDQVWLEDSDRPVLGHWFEQRPGRHQRGARPGDLPPFFANLLPEGDLSLLLRDRLGVALDDDLGLLIAVGKSFPCSVQEGGSTFQGRMSGATGLPRSPSRTMPGSA
jgi:serine/threonine-protein kinase HipA